MAAPQTDVHSRHPANDGRPLTAESSQISDSTPASSHTTVPIMGASLQTDAPPSPECMPHSFHENEEFERGRTLKRSRRTHYGRATKRVQKRYTEDIASDSSPDPQDIWNDYIQESIMAKLKNKPDLKPGSRSRSSVRAGSSSPSRKQMHQLKYSIPAVNFISELEVPPGPAWDLRTSLRAAGMEAFINKAMFDRVDSRLREDIIGHQFAKHDESFRRVDTDRLFDLLDETVATSARCEEIKRNEAQWTNLVIKFLEGVLLLERNANPACHRFELLDIRTDGYRDAFLPKHPKAAGSDEESSVSAKKTDLILGWHNKFEPAKTLCERFAGAKTLNHLHQSSAETAPTQCAIEIKATTAPGASDEAKLQLAMCHAAAIGHLLVDAAEGGDAGKEFTELPLQVGFVVQGHNWELFISEYDHEHGRILFAGPMTKVPMGTEDHVSLLRLVAVLRALLQWLSTDYWTAFEARMTATG